MVTGAAQATERRQPTAEPLHWLQYLGYAGGDAANNLTFSMTSMFLLLYYTDVVGISAAAAGALLLVARVVHAFADILAGRVVDRTSSKWGRFRPFFLFGGVPLGLLSVAAFLIPGGLSNGAAIVWAFVSYALFGLAYSLVNIPFGSLASVMTQEPQERAKLGTARSIGTSVGIILLSFVVSPQISASSNLQRSLTVTTSIFAVVIVALYLLLFRTSREAVEHSSEAVSLKASLKAIRSNRPLLLLCLNAVFALSGMFVLQSVQMYYARDVLGDADYFPILTILSIGATFVVVPMVPNLVDRFGKKTLYIAGLVIGAVGGVGITVSPPSPPWIAFVSFGVYGCGLACVQMLMWTLEADTVEYGEWKANVRTEGSNYAALSFTRKVGQGIGAGLAAWGIGVGGYISGAQTQSEGAVWALRFTAGALPAVCLAIAAAVMLAYPLTEQAFSAIIVGIANRRAEREVTSA